ncbi:MAG: hypothetical protein AB7E47_14310, partial [Desulfovibrionaceae bacterium]
RFSCALMPACVGRHAPAARANTTYTTNSMPPPRTIEDPLARAIADKAPGEGERRGKTPFSKHKKGFSLSSLLPPDPHPLFSLFPQKLLAGAVDTVGTREFPRRAASLSVDQGMEGHSPDAVSRKTSKKT